MLNIRNDRALVIEISRSQKKLVFSIWQNIYYKYNFVFLLWRLWSRWGLLSWRGEVGRGVSGAAVCGQQIQQRILTLNNSKAKRYCEITLRLLYNNSKKLRGTVKSHCGYCTITAKLKGTVKSHCGYCTITTKSYEVQWNHTAVIVL